MAKNFNTMSKRELDYLQMKRCPYNHNHIVKKTRFQRHITECESHLNPSDQNKWKTCPFNASHRIPVDEYDNHLITCVDNGVVLMDSMEVMRRNQLNESLNQSFLEELQMKLEKEDFFIKVTGIKEETVEPSVRPKLLSNKFDAKDVENIKIEVKEEMDEKPKRFVKIKEEDDWNDPEVEDYSIFQFPESTTAEDIIKNEKYMSDNKGVVDHISYQRLAAEERKRLNKFLVERTKKSADITPNNTKNTDEYFQYYSVPKVVNHEPTSTELELSNPVLKYVKQRAEVWPPVAEPMVNALSSHSLNNRLHSVNIPPDYNKMVVQDQRGHQNKSTALAAALHSIDLSDEKPEITDVLIEGPLRLPKTNPFRTLRKPMTASDMTAIEAVPKQEKDLNNN